MQTLFSDGFHSSTLTTYEDPLLILEMYTDGNQWKLNAYLGDKWIDSIDLDKIRTRHMERVIANTKGINIPVRMNYAGMVTGEKMLQEYLAECLDIVKGLDYAFGPNNPANYVELTGSLS